jgi:cysteine desulfurase
VPSTAYLDYAATTPCDRRVLEEMIPYFCDVFGNSSSHHYYGLQTLEGLDIARIRVRELINADFEEVVFTSGATESNQIAIVRVMSALKAVGKTHFLTLKTEHKSILDDADFLRRNDFDVTLLDVKNDGLLDLDHLEHSLKDSSGLFSFCLVNNETGVIQDIAQIVEICTKRGVLVHADATQAFGKIPVDVKALNIDFLSASGHKIYGPKGIGVFFYKKSNRRLVRIPGANNDVEFGIRAGTVPVALCVGLGKAAEIAKAESTNNLKHIKNLRNKFISGITKQLDKIYINGSQSSCFPGIINMSFRGCEGEAIMMEAKHLAVSSGSACTSNKLTISHVLDAMHIPADIAQSSIRISIGKPTTKEEIDIAIEEFISAIKKLRSMSPVWDIIQSGLDVNTMFNKTSF